MKIQRRSGQTVATTPSGIITAKDHAEATRLIERRKTALKVVDSLFEMPRPQKWIAARNVWVALSLANARAHTEAVMEAKEARAAALDPKYGRSAAALGKAPGQKVNKNTSMRLVAIFPAPYGRDSLKDWLKRIDPQFLGMPTGREYRLNWRKVYKVFPEYTIPQRVDGYYEGGRA